jgi:hypothetical protein
VAGLTIISTGTGTVAHFGQAVMVSPSCVNLSTYDIIGPVPFSLTAASGDVVSGFLTNFAYTEYGFDMFVSIDEGTGRFEGATGELVFPTRSNFTGSWTAAVEGWISY